MSLDITGSGTATRGVRRLDALALSTPSYTRVGTVAQRLNALNGSPSLVRRSVHFKNNDKLQKKNKKYHDGSKRNFVSKTSYSIVNKITLGRQLLCSYFVQNMLN